MNGFGLYETLRLLVPGAIAVAVITTVLRLATAKVRFWLGDPSPKASAHSRAPRSCSLPLLSASSFTSLTYRPGLGCSEEILLTRSFCRRTRCGDPR